MFCPECGTKNEDNALFCASCGAKIEDTTISTPTESAPTETVTQTTDYSQFGTTPQPEQAATNYSQFGTTPQQPVQQNFNASFNANPQPVAPKAPIKINPLMIVTIAEAVLVIVAIVVFALVGKSTYSYEKVAKSYFDALVAGDWETAYELIDVTDSEFINKEMFAIAHADDVGLDINKSKVLGSYGTEMMATVTIQYSEKETGEVQTLEINLSKQAKNNFLFFDKWKVSSAQYIAKDYEVSVPSGATLFLDGKEVPSSMISNEGSYSTQYVIPKVFKGEHTIQMELSDFTGAEKTVYVDYDNDYDSISDITLTQKQQEEVIALAYENLQRLMEATAAGEDFDSVSDIYSTEAVDDAEDSYEYVEDDFVRDADDTDALLELSLTEVEADMNYITIDDGAVRADVKIRYAYDSRYKDWWDGEEETDYGTDYETWSYIYEDGEWKLNSTSMPDYYYYY